MLINWEFFLEVFFDFTLFFLLVVVVYKLFVSYALPFLRHQIKEIKERQENIRDKIKLLDASQARLESQVLEQQNQFIDLGGKVKLWHESVEGVNKKILEQRSKLLKKIKIKREKQAEHFCLFKLEKNVITQAINETYDTLSPIQRKEKTRFLLEELVNKISEPYKDTGIN